MKSNNFKEIRFWFQIKQIWINIYYFLKKAKKKSIPIQSSFTWTNEMQKINDLFSAESNAKKNKKRGVGFKRF